MTLARIAEDGRCHLLIEHLKGMAEKLVLFTTIQFLEKLRW